MMFLKTNDRYINLRNVSNVNILRNKKRIVFNMNYSIDMPHNDDDKKISDYAYWDSRTQKEFDDNINELLQMGFFENNFITQNDDDCWINVNEISSIKMIDDRLRVIINLSHPVTFKNRNGDDKITSEFVYVNCKTKSEYEKYCDYIKESLEM